MEILILLPTAMCHAPDISHNNFKFPTEQNLTKLAIVGKLELKTGAHDLVVENSSR